MKLQKAIVCSIIFLSYSFYFLSACNAADELIAVESNWAPFSILSRDSKEEFTGINIDILNGLEKHLGRKIRIEYHPWSRMLEMIKKGYADLIVGIAHTDDRAEYIKYIPTSYCAVKSVFYTQKGRGHLIKSYDDLYKFSIGYVRDSAYFEPFDSDERLNKISISTESQLVNMGAIGRIDVIVGTNPNLSYDIKKFELKDKLELTGFTPQSQTPIFIGLSKKNSKLLKLEKEIDNYVKRIIENGKLKEILNKYN